MNLYEICAPMNAIEKELTADCYASHILLPKNLPIIFHEMAKIQEVKAVPTFGLHADAFLTKIIVTAHLYSSCRVDFFCDFSRNQS